MHFLIVTYTVHGTRTSMVPKYDTSINNQRCAHETIYEGSSPIVRVRVQLRCAFLVFPEVRYGSTEVRRHISVRIVFTVGLWKY